MNSETALHPKPRRQRRAPPVRSDAEFERRKALVMRSVDLYQDYLMYDAYEKTRNWHDAENLMQDLWEHVLLHFREEYIGNLGILRRKLFQKFVDEYRYKKRRSEVLTDRPPEPAEPSAAAEALTDAEEAALKVRFWEEYPDIALTDLQKQAVWLHARFGYTYQEVAQKIGVPKSTIGDWIAHARTELTRYLNTETR